MVRFAGIILRALKSRSGSVAVMAGILLPTVLLAAVLGVDQGSLYFERREAQALTDLAAITAAANIARADTAAMLTMADNRQQGVELVDRATITSAMGEGVRQQLLVEIGRYEADAGIDAAQRFTPGATPPNAARVILRKRGTLRLGSGIFNPPVMTTTGIATARAEAAFSVGSRLASIDTGRAAILNKVLGGLLGTSLSLHAMDYEALTNTDIDVLGFANALASELHLTTGTYSDVLAAEATLGQVLRATAAAAPSRDVQHLLLQLAGGSNAGRLRLPLSHLIDLGSLGRLAVGEAAQGMQTAVGVMDLIGASTAIANRQNQVQVDLGAQLGLVSATVEIAVGEPPQGLPWFAIGETGKIVRTAQTRLYLVVSVGGPGGVIGTIIRVPLNLELAYAEAQLKEVACAPSSGASRVSIEARPGVVEAWLGDIDPSDLRRFDRKPAQQWATLVDRPRTTLFPGITVLARANFHSGGMCPTTLTFNRQEIMARAVKTASSCNMAQSLFLSLLSSLELDIDLDVAGIGVGLPNTTILKGLVREHILATVAEPVDSLVDVLLPLLGVRVGEADIRVNGASCSRSVLVN